MTGNREFISGTLAEVQAGNKIVKRDKNGVVVFSPFGLGVLDIAVAKLVASLAADLGVGTVLESFLPNVSKK
jgi:ornithine cyclodeaminase